MIALKFYIYLHCKPDLTPFYVGKGTLKRCYEFGVGRRTLHHQHIVNKYGKDNIVVVVFKKDSEESAFESEIRMIKILRNAGFELCNKTGGGEGSQGHKQTPEHRAKIAAKLLGNKNTLGHKNGLGRKDTPEQLAQKSARFMGNKYALGGKWNIGRKMSAASIEKRTASRKYNRELR